MIDYKKIEKIHPLILFTVFILAITAILPLFFLAPPATSNQPFQNEAVSGSITYELNKTEIFLTLRVNSMNPILFTNNKTNFHIIISINTIDSYMFDFNVFNYSKNSFPIHYSKTINLTKGADFGSSFNIRSELTVNSGSNVYGAYSFNNSIGRNELQIYDRWLVITVISSLGMFAIPLFYLKYIKNFSFIPILREFWASSYSLYLKILDQINDNSYFVIFFAPTLIIFSFLYQVYLRFSFVTNSSLLFFNSKIMLYFLLSMHALLIVLSPAIVDYIVDYLKGNPLVQKNRIKDNLIFLPFLVLFYGFEFILVRFAHSSLMFYIMIFLAFFFNFYIYYVSLKFYITKFNYHISQINLIFLAIGYRILYSGFVYFILLFFIFSSPNYPIYLLLI